MANVVTTGQFTIPLMKRFGYKSGNGRPGPDRHRHPWLSHHPARSPDSVLLL
ncbi:hypothetical protein QIY50_26425 [Pseudomonas putida]|nr:MULTISPECIES: hypothetical protein [unclassified Pseudomonas]WGV20723.1 hypothetical protein QIY50_26425 [Pseudomonas putida]